MTPQRIDNLYAWIATEPDGGEGLCGAQIYGLGWAALVGADRERIESLRPFAEIIARDSGYPISLKVFGGGTVIDAIKP